MLRLRSGRCVAGVDVGSTLTKVVVASGEGLASATDRTRIDYARAAARLLTEALERAGRAPADLTGVVATGYGRRRLPWASREVTEITCHARGVAEIIPAARTIVDIGGQDAKGIKVGPGGRVVNFVMNDKCAAGTGRFLEVMAASLGLTIDELGHRAVGAPSQASVSSICTVFAEQEVAQRLAEGAALADVLAGLHDALASRIHRMVRRLRIESPVVLTGGCARNPGLVRALEQRLGTSVLTPPDPLLTGALGAALLVGEATERGEDAGVGTRLEEAALGARGDGDRIEPADERGAKTFLMGCPAPYSAEGQFRLPPGHARGSSPIAGVDAGALFIKAAVVAGDRVNFAVLRSDGNYLAGAARALERALAGAGVARKALSAVAATGLGASKIGVDRQLSEITCLAAGIALLFPDAGQVIDIGGHGTRVIRLGAEGAVTDFSASGQCAAGSARILEVIAHLVGLELERLGEVSLRSREPAAFSAGCAVFAETEAISLLTRGVSREDLVAGLHRSMAAKILAMARGNGVSGPSAIAGGGAKDSGLVARLGAVMGPLAVPPEPMVVAALGAALLAVDRTP